MLLLVGSSRVGSALRLLLAGNCGWSINGSYVKLLNDGTIQIGGDLHVNGDVYDSQGALSRLRGHYDAHTHIDSRGDKTTPTSQPD